MKVLDVNTFQEGLERNLNRLTRLESEMKQIEITIQGLTNLEESLKGQGGEALRGYYENCHLPFLEFFNTFKASFSTVLQEMASALSTLEPDLSGFIRQEALEGEVEQGLNHAKQVTEELTNETNQIMNQVCDIVSLPNLDDSEVQAEVLKAKSHRDQTVEHLNTFDLTQTMALATIQNDLLLMRTWITNIESMMTEDVTDVNFPAEQWKAFASQNPLMIQLAARTQSMDSIIAMNPLLAPGMVGGANPYSLSSFQLNGQLPQYNFGIQGAAVSTNFVSFMKKREEEIAKDLSCPAPTDVDEVKEEENKLLAFLGDVGNGAVKLGKGALDVGKEVADFLILDDINTIMDADASGLDKGIALASIIPVGKVLKGAKLVDKIIDSNVDDVVKKSNVDEVSIKGIEKVEYGAQYTKVNGKKALKPNVEYKTPEGYKYETDEKGRIVTAEANLELGKVDRNNYAQRKVGGEDRQSTDDGGHLIASIFKGSGNIDNLVPMNSTLNRSEYKILENTWKKALVEGKEVKVNVKPIYEGKSTRPSEFKINYSINGKKYSERLTNYSGGT